MQMTHGGLRYKDSPEKKLTQVIERAHMLAMRITLKNGGFFLLDEPRHQAATVLSNTEVNASEVRVELRLADGNTVRSWWRFEGTRISLKALQILYSYSGDPGGLTSPIGIPEPYELVEEEILNINQRMFSSAED